MADTQDRFTFRHSRHLPGVTALDAVMRDFSYDRHAHEEMALGVTISGRQDFFCRGAQFSSTPGKVILFNPGDVHDGSPGPRSTLRYAMLYIRRDQLVPLMGHGRNAARRLPRVPGALVDDAALRWRILALSRLILGRGGTRMEQELHLYELARRLQRLADPSRSEPAVERMDAFAHVRDYIHAHLDSDLSMDQLCAVANMSKFHFIRLFRGRFGITPHKYVLSCRINKARKALEQGRTPTDTAQLCGFFDASHLNRRFKRAHGLTPRQYQLQFNGSRSC